MTTRMNWCVYRLMDAATGADVEEVESLSYFLHSIMPILAVLHLKYYNTISTWIWVKTVITAFFLRLFTEKWVLSIHKSRQNLQVFPFSYSSDFASTTSRSAAPKFFLPNSLRKGLKSPSVPWGTPKKSKKNWRRRSVPICEPGHIYD